MRTLVFTACILAVVMVGDAHLMNIMHMITSNIFHAQQLIDLHVTIAECTMKLGLSKIFRPELTFCIAQKKDLVDKEDEILWDDSLAYIKTLIRDENKVDKIKELFQKCKKQADKFEGSKYEKSLKAIECGLSNWRYIIQQLLTLPMK